VTASENSLRRITGRQALVLRYRDRSWLLALAMLGCEPDSSVPRSPDDSPGRTASAPGSAQDRGQAADSATRAFADTVIGRLLDTQVHELRGELFLKVRNPNPDDESPLVDRPVDHAATPGPHTYEGILHAEIGALRAVLGDTLPVSIEEENIFVGTTPVLIRAHRHGTNVYVPVKLFARQYGAYVDVTCTLANCGMIWARPTLEYMRGMRGAPAAGLAEAHAEGLIDGVNVRARGGG
jgi:hypothetical protein